MTVDTVFVRARELGRKLPRCECHIHTAYTDGQNTVEEIVHASLQMGLEMILFTDHVRRTSTFLDQYLEDINRQRARFGRQLSIYAGVEVKVVNYEGELDMLPQLKERVDYVVGVVHSYPARETGPIDMRTVSPSVALEAEYQATKGLLESGGIDIIGHIGGTYADRFGVFPPELFAELVRIAKRNSVAVEINSAHHRNLADVLRICRLINPYVSLGSDVHSLEDIGDVLRKVRKVL